MQKYLDQFDKWLEGILKDLPKLPDGGKKFLVEIFPWLALLGGIMGLMGIVGALGLGGMMVGMAAVIGYHFGLIYWLHVLILIGLTVLDFKAFKPLKEKKMKGWQLSWQMTVLALVDVVIGLNIGGLIGVAIGFYLLYQVKGEYK